MKYLLQYGFLSVNGRSFSLCFVFFRLQPARGLAIQNSPGMVSRFVLLLSYITGASSPPCFVLCICLVCFVCKELVYALHEKPPIIYVHTSYVIIILGTFCVKLLFSIYHGEILPKEFGCSRSRYTTHSSGLLQRGTP